MDHLTTSYLCTEYVTTVRWRIDNFSIHVSKVDPDYYCRSPPFKFYKSRLTFCLGFRPTVKHQKDSSMIILGSLNLDNEKSIGLSWKIFIEDSMGNQIKDYPG